MGIFDWKQAALHELLRAAAGFAHSLLGAGQESVAQHFARGVPPIAMWHESTSSRARAGRSSAARSAGSSVLSRPSTTPATTPCSSGWSGPSRASTPRRSSPRRGIPRRMIEAVVFDLDGVVVDSEQVWDDVREQLAKERGGRWHEGAQAAMMGMSSPEWSTYMHDEIGL